MNLRLALVAALCLTPTPPAAAQDLAPAAPESAGMSSDRLAEATRALQAHVNGSNIAGVVAAVARHGRLVYFEALGQRDREAGDPMERD
ncbi:MAG: serine hydrolase, partial [Acidobacteria bacterium]|nr:serine hydrolase [Acidobacteriota bacterium]